MKPIVIGLAAAFHLFVLLGLITHTTANGPVLGRYNPLYALGLALFALALIPLLRFAAFLCVTTRIEPADAEPVLFTPAKKAKVLGLIAALILIPTELTLQYRATHRSSGELKKFHPFLQLQGRPSRESLHTNRHGFRGPEIDLAKPPNTTRIFFLGGSTVYCAESAFETSHVRVLEKKLAARYPQRRFEVQNAGIDWYTTQHSIIDYLFRIKDFKPDLILLFHGINDLCRSFAPRDLAIGEPRPDYGHFFGPVARLMLGPNPDSAIPRPYIIDQLLDDLLYSDLAHPTPTRVDEWVSLPPFERNLRSLIQILRTDKVPLVLGTQPAIYRPDLEAKADEKLWMNARLCEYGGRYPDTGSMASGLERFNEVTRRVTRELNTPCVELDKNIPKDLEHFRDDCHFTDQGNARVAQLFFAEIERLALFE